MQRQNNHNLLILPYKKQMKFSLDFHHIIYDNFDFQSLFLHLNN